MSGKILLQNLLDEGMFCELEHIVSKPASGIGVRMHKMWEGARMEEESGAKI